MIPVNKPLLALTAADLMTPAVVAVPEAMSLRGAARLLSHAGVSGAPVVDAAEHCVGVISATDFLHWAKNEGKPAGPQHSCETIFEGQIVDPWEMPEDRVCAFMTRDVVTVPPTAAIGELARMMIDAHIHRIIVVDGAGHPVGIVSSTDLLAALARADCQPRTAREQPAVEPCRH